jgi:YebC/PmpR family DNA-binding regulatory protein
MFHPIKHCLKFSIIQSRNFAANAGAVTGVIITFLYSTIYLSSIYHNLIFFIGRHAKNVAKKKGKLDLAKNKIFSRLSVKLTIAAKNGGPDPSTNSELKRVLSEATSINLPKENIQKAIKKTTEQNQDDWIRGVYEVYGFGGVGCIISTLTNNSTRTFKKIKEISKKGVIKIASNGSIMFKYEHKGIFTPSKPYDEDNILETSINADIDEIDFIENDNNNNDDEDRNINLIITTPSFLNLLQDTLLIQDITGTTNLGYVAQDKITVSQEDYDKNINIIELFEAEDDIDQVYHDMLL